jgi:hypothetical protein
MFRIVRVILIYHRQNPTDLINSSRIIINVMKFIIIQFPLVICYFVHLRPKLFLQDSAQWANVPSTGFQTYDYQHNQTKNHEHQGKLTHAVARTTQLIDKQKRERSEGRN